MSGCIVGNQNIILTIRLTQILAGNTIRAIASRREKDFATEPKDGEMEGVIEGIEDAVLGWVSVNFETLTGLQRIDLKYGDSYYVPK